MPSPRTPARRVWCGPMPSTERPRACTRARAPLGAAALLCAAVLAGCASGPQRGPNSERSERSERDGAEANPPADLARIADAEPRLEPIRSGGPNKPYEVLGRSYVPITQD